MVLEPIDQYGWTLDGNNCSKPGHLARDCRAPKKQSNGRHNEGKGKSAGAKQVQVLPSAGAEHPVRLVRL